MRVRARNYSHPSAEYPSFYTTWQVTGPIHLPASLPLSVLTGNRGSLNRGSFCPTLSPAFFFKDGREGNTGQQDYTVVPRFDIFRGRERATRLGGSMGERKRHDWSVKGKLG